MSKPVQTIGLLTGGGDCPGLNAVIRAVVLSAVKNGWEVIGIKRGYEGLLDTGQTLKLTEEIRRRMPSRKRKEAELCSIPTDTYMSI